MKALTVGMRMALAAKFKEWARENGADEGITNFVAFLQMNGLLNPKKTSDFIKEKKES